MNIWPTSIESIKKSAQAQLDQVDALEAMIDLPLPGRFVFSPPSSSRLAVGNMKELHAARKILRKEFGWKDHLTNKFCSGEEAIVVYEPHEDIILPLPFSLWVDAPVHSFPTELLGECEIEAIHETTYTIICPIKE